MTRLVLHVEDNDLNVRLVERILRLRPEITLLTADNGEHGLQIANEQPPDLILLDLHVHGLSGDEVLRRLKASTTTEGIPVIVLSGDSKPETASEVLKLGAVAFIAKPFEIPNLLDAIDQFCGPPVD